MRCERIGGKGGSHVIRELSGSDLRSRGWDLVLRVRGWPRGSAAGPRVGRAECALVTLRYHGVAQKCHCTAVSLM